MKISFTLGIVLLYSLSVYSQEGILLKNCKTGESIFYKKGTKLCYSTKPEYEYIKGWLNHISDSTISVDDITIPLKKIHSIQKRNYAHKIARIVGIPFILIGCVFSGDAIARIIAKPESENKGTSLLIGAGFMAMGYLPYFINLKEYVFSQEDTCEWSLQTCKKCSLP